MSRIHLVWIALLVGGAGCGDNAPGGEPDAATSVPDARVDASVDSVDAAVDARPDDGHPRSTLRLMAANISSGADQAYHEAGIHILHGLDPDVVMMQEVNIG